MAVTYQGNPCRKGHDGIRLTSGHCYECQRAGGRTRDRARYAFRRADPQKNRDYWNTWRLDNVHRERARGRASAAIRKARMFAAGGEYSYHDIISMYAMQQGRCAAFWCRTDLAAGYHVDHITALARGGTNGPENLQLLCPSCNMSKADDCMFDFYLRRVGGGH